MAPIELDEGEQTYFWKTEAKPFEFKYIDFGMFQVLQI